jgi:alkanesulfonate monooxygenase SsuD/methylene tetrahydromethanopterin reductase-like flavin-dependent oxidoreductase (luciferase family)
MPIPIDGRVLKVGVFLPVDRPWAELRDMAVACEELGFDSLWLQDHLIFRRANGSTGGAHECWTLLSALAAATRHVELGTLVICMPFRNPALLAKMADALHDVSGGRLILGIGAGWHQPEFDAFGYPFDHRASRFEEAIQIVTGLLREGAIDFTGRFHQAPSCALLPRGPLPPPKVLVGTRGERMLRLTARYADLWQGVWVSDPAEVPARRDLIDAACRDVGRDPLTLGRTIGFFVNLPGAKREAGAAIARPEELTDKLRAIAAEGIEHVQLFPDPWNLDAIKKMAPALRAAG